MKPSREKLLAAAAFTLVGFGNSLAGEFPTNECRAARQHTRDLHSQLTRVCNGKVLPDALQFHASKTCMSVGDELLQAQLTQEKLCVPNVASNQK